MDMNFEYDHIVENTKTYKNVMIYINEIFEYRKTINHKLASNTIKDMVERYNYLIDEENNDIEAYYGHIDDEELIMFGNDNIREESNYISHDLVKYCMLKSGYICKSKIINETTYHKYNVRIKKNMKEIIYN